MAENEQEIEIDRALPMDIEELAIGLTHNQLVYDRMSEEEVMQKMQEYELFQATHSVPKGNFPKQGFAIPLKYTLPELYTLSEVKDENGEIRPVYGIRHSSRSLDELLIGEHTKDGKLLIHGTVHPYEKGENPKFYSKITRNVERANVVPVTALFRNIPQLQETARISTKTGAEDIMLADLISGAAASQLNRAKPNAVTIQLPNYALSNHLQNTKDAYARPIYGGKFRIIIE